MKLHTITNSILHSKTYILSTQNENQAWLIDCGNTEPILNYLEENKLILKGVLLTHTHFDHIYGLNTITSLFPEIHIYTSKEGANGLFNEKNNLSNFFEQPWKYNYHNITILTEQSELYLLNIPVKCYYTPGHDISCLSYEIDNFFFTGDSFIPGVKAFVKWPLSKKDDAQFSEEKILNLINRKKLKIKAGH